MPRAAIVGAGLMGSAMAWPLADNGNELRLVGTHLDDDIIDSCREKRFHPRLGRTIPEAVTPYRFSEIDEALEGCDLVVGGVNSLGVDWLAAELVPRLAPGQLVVGITKGLRAGAEGAVVVFPRLLEAALPEKLRGLVKFAAIGGPCIAGELAGRRQSMVMVGADDLAAAESIASRLRTAYYHPIPTSELLGLEVGVALKNAYTVAVGIAYGMLERAGGPDEAKASMHNLAAALFAQGCFEIRTVLRLLGADENLAAALPGAGDLYVTSMGGRTVRFGKLLGSGHGFAAARKMMAGETLESIEIIKAMDVLMTAWREKALLAEPDLPLMRSLVDVVVRGRILELSFDGYFRVR